MVYYKMKIFPLLIRIFYPFWGLVNWYYIRKSTGGKMGVKYVAVVFTNKTFRDKWFIYCSGVILLLKYLEKTGTPYILMKEFDIQKFREIIYDENCYGLYIIGHGMRHGLKISKEEMLYYCSFRDAPKKEFVVQLHCNHLGGESLADIIAKDKEKSYVSGGLRHVIPNTLYFLELLRNEDSDR
jgi:hypothetical protein